jgi:hypothetical protein
MVIRRNICKVEKEVDCVEEEYDGNEKWGIEV